MRDEAGRERGYTAHRARWVSPTKLRYYHVLGVEPGASLEELKEAHRDLVKVWHPDRFGDDPRLQRKAQEKLKEINEAYEQILPDTLPAPPHPVPEPEWPARRYAPEIRLAAPEAPPADLDPPSEPARRRWGLSPQAAAAFALLGVTALIVVAVVRNDDTRRSTTADSNVNREASDALEDAPIDVPTFTLGSTQEEVLSVQGTPTGVEGGRWLYQLSSVDFAEGKVEGYANVSRNLHVRLKPAGDAQAALARSAFTLGSTADDVLAVQGTPTSVEGRRWRYDSSSVDFVDGKVESYDNAEGNLHVRVNPKGDVSAARARGAFTLGSTEDEVLAVQGTPTSIEGERWTYDSSTVSFSNGRVDAYSNETQKLHFEMTPQGDVAAARTRGFFTLGSTGDDVLAVQGTPTSVGGNRWGYELSWVVFDQGKVEGYSNVSGNLRVRAR
ncbi:MAG TPA: J domain-containing protein [Terriglobia bacterium]|nr:J domain-containing protein [Terriglobia bacterium]